MGKTDSVLDIKDILNEYSSDIQEGIQAEAQSIGKQAVADLRATKGTYKIRTGKYNAGWKVNTKKGRGEINCTVWNSTSWRLTHLLEKGHLNRDGSRTKAYVHIAPIEKKYVNEYQKNIEELIKNGG